MDKKIPFFDTTIGTLIKVGLIIIALTFVYVIQEDSFTITTYDFLYNTFFCISLSLALINYAYAKETIQSSLMMGVTRKNVWKSFIKKVGYSYLIIFCFYFSFTLIHLLIYKNFKFMSTKELYAFLFMTAFYFSINFISFYLGQIKAPKEITVLLYVLFLIAGLITIKAFHLYMSILMVLASILFYILSRKKILKK